MSQILEIRRWTNVWRSLITDWPGIRIYCADQSVAGCCRDYQPSELPAISSKLQRAGPTLCWPVPGRGSTTARCKLQRQRAGTNERPAKSWDEIWLDEGLTSPDQRIVNFVDRRVGRVAIPTIDLDRWNGIQFGSQGLLWFSETSISVQLTRVPFNSTRQNINRNLSCWKIFNKIIILLSGAWKIAWRIYDYN